VDSKSNEELMQTYTSSNQITGLFNRLEGPRKYAFSSVGVANDSRIAGVLIVRGPDVMPVIQVAPDWGSYDSTEIEFGNGNRKHS